MQILQWRVYFVASVPSGVVAAAFLRGGKQLKAIHWGEKQGLGSALWNAQFIRVPFSTFFSHLSSLLSGVKLRCPFAYLRCPRFLGRALRVWGKCLSD